MLNKSFLEIGSTKQTFFSRQTLA